MEFVKEISVSEAQYFIKQNENTIGLGGGGQKSYNLPVEFLNKAMDKGVLIEDPNMDYYRKDKDGNAVVLNNEYVLKLGSGVIWLIGDEFDNEKNKFIGSVASNEKFQLYRTVYNKLKLPEYQWFVALYDKNLAKNELVLDIDEENKRLTIDIRFKSIVSKATSEPDRKPFNTNIDKPYNRIIFGAPGTGKSNRLEEDRKLFGNNFERVTFHPNYLYSQFVGTYKPVPIKEIDCNGEEKSSITYEYVPGPFMRTYVKAMKKNSEPHLLLIEEINRANVAAVFGDVFQLLDRKDGISEYEIATSEDMKYFLSKELGGSKEQYEKIKIPNNMYIWATMNSADQGVFPMDTAFKRRWEFEYIGVNENCSGIKDVMVKLGSGNNERLVNWNELRMAINDKLSECNINEDKLLGPYFLSKDVLKVSGDSNLVEDNEKFKEAFKSKVIMYLYEDAGKQYKKKIFEGCEDCNKYSSVCREFDKNGIAIFGNGIISTELQEE